jgi:hypothetical protein
MAGKLTSTRMLRFFAGVFRDAVLTFSEGAIAACVAAQPLNRTAALVFLFASLRRLA